jgi:hypothetical protein
MLTRRIAALAMRVALGRGAQGLDAYPVALPVSRSFVYEMCLTFGWMILIFLGGFVVAALSAVYKLAGLSDYGQLVYVTSFPLIVGAAGLVLHGLRATADLVASLMRQRRGDGHVRPNSPMVARLMSSSDFDLIVQSVAALIVLFALLRE